MKRSVIHSILTMFIILNFLPLPAHAILSDKVNIPPNSRIVIMVGTYSPLHNRHIEQIRAVANSGFADFVLVIPNDMTVHKPFAVDAEIRLDGLAAVFGDDPKVIVPHSLRELGFPVASKVRKYLNEKFENLQWAGAVGKDSSLSFWAPIGAHLQSMQYWLILTPDAHDEQQIPKTFGGKPTKRIYSPTENDVRSTQIRQAIKEQNFKALAQLLPEPIIEIIKEHDLYRKPDPKPTLKIYLRNCVTLTKKLLK